MTWQSAADRVARRCLPGRLQLPLRFRYYRLAAKLPEEIALLRRFAGRGRVAIDVGANQGIFSYAMAQIYGSVIAFEPQPWCAAAIRAYGNPRIAVHQVALSSASSSGQVYVPRDHASGRLTTGLARTRPWDTEQMALDVPFCTLDEFEPDDVDFIKIDVEGHEAAVLRGARRTIAAHRPTLLIEIEQRHLTDGDVMDVIGEVESLGYAAYFVQSGALLPAEEFRYEQHQQPYLDHVDDRRYANDFIFLPRDSAPRRELAQSGGKKAGL
jgi:FkbM family methyltransferase